MRHGSTANLATDSFCNWIVVKAIPKVGPFACADDAVSRNVEETWNGFHEQETVSLCVVPKTWCQNMFCSGARYEEEEDEEQEQTEYDSPDQETSFTSPVRDPGRLNKWWYAPLQSDQNSHFFSVSRTKVNIQVLIRTFYSSISPELGLDWFTEMRLWTLRIIEHVDEVEIWEDSILQMCLRRSSGMDVQSRFCQWFGCAHLIFCLHGKFGIMQMQCSLPVTNNLLDFYLPTIYY